MTIRSLERPLRHTSRGRGLTGLTTALLLARGGQSVLVVEAERLGGVTTRRSSAKVTALQGTKLSSIAQKHPRHVVEAYVMASVEGLDWLRSFCAEHEVAHRGRTAYTYATTAEGREQVLDETASRAPRDSRCGWTVTSTCRSP